MSIASRFKEFERKEIGTIPTLSKAIRSMKFKKSEINLAFKKFVPNEEYAKNERDEILEDLYEKTLEISGEKDAK